MTPLEFQKLIQPAQQVEIIIDDIEHEGWYSADKGELYYCYGGLFRAIKMDGRSLKYHRPTRLFSAKSHKR